MVEEIRSATLTRFPHPRKTEDILGREESTRLGMDSSLASVVDGFIEEFTFGDRTKYFIETNESEWEDFMAERGRPSSGDLLVDVTLDNPGYYFPHNLLANYIARELDLEPVCLLGGVQNRRLKRICESYGFDRFVYLNLRKAHPAITLKSYLDARDRFGQLETGKDLLDLKYGGIPIGDLVYNTYLRRTGEGTISEINDDLLPYVSDAILYKNFYDHVFDEYNVEAVVQTHLFYYKCGILARTALDRDVDVYARDFGPVSFILKKYDELDEARTSPIRPSPSLVDYVAEHHHTEAIEKAERYLNDRLSGQTDAEVANRAYGEDTNSLTREAAFKDHSLPTDHPIAVIMPHVFTDAVHSYSWLLFQDYLTWFRKTLEHAIEQSSVNWLVKPHPSAELYDCEQTVADEFDRIAGRGDHNVVLIPETTNTSSLIDIADAVITARGTAGLEFACFGVPSIIAGESKYSGFDVAIEPQTKREYFEALNRIPELTELEDRQVALAKILTYVQFMVTRIRTDIVPDIPWTSEFDEEEKLEDAADLLLETGPEEDTCYRTIQTFLRNQRFGQAIDYEEIGWDLAGAR